MSPGRVVCFTHMGQSEIDCIATLLKMGFEHHTKFLTVHAYKKAVCDWCQSAKTECTHLPCGHVIHSVRDVVCPIL